MSVPFTEQEWVEDFILGMILALIAQGIVNSPVGMKYFFG